MISGAASQQIENTKKNDKPLSVIMVDLDFFREINDNYGHETGDRMIMAVVNTYNQILRETDILARYGGDEFTILLPETDLAAAEQIAEKVRQEIEALDILKEFNGPIKNVTLSQGVASFPESAEDLKTLKENADQALYRAKESGRNRCCVYADETEPVPA